MAVNLLGILLLYASGVFADYIQGIDTTDVNGYGLDSAFKVTNGKITGQNIVVYHMDGSMNGYFNYSFDDIKMARESKSYIISNGPNGQCTYWVQDFSNQYQINNYCFVINKFKDSTYSKIQILNNLGNNRYVFKYGTNTSPNDRILEKTPYDSSVRYKPNNFCNIWSYYNCSDWFPSIECCFWEPPLPNNNHLLGYMFYGPKPGAVIDTTKPINLAQWDSVNFTTSTYGGWNEGYLGLVAVYEEGKSDFLQNWWTPKRTDFQIDIKPSSTPVEKIQKSLEIKKAPTGFSITFSSLPNNPGPSSLSIYNLFGTKVAEFSNIQGNRVFWKTTDRNLAQGQYIIRSELPDKRVLSGRMVYSK